MSAPSPYEVRVRVEPTDLDDQDHVNNVVYVRWVQDAAIAHWRALTTTDIQATVGWALLRHEIDYRAAARLGDEVIVRTRVGHLEGITFERLTDIRRAADGRVLAESRTLWCPIDPRSGRPRRVSEEVRSLFSAG
ncbi:acyl-CoA thioesterase [Gemmatirosa kalamazoonensis]|uniref:acyl-CoA thioesterase n=1 Tax=Gemmatirosa kalamazoonensis TaxID=861299 RepID=UPI00046C9EC3|nr:thioesterase family protein [Gemmatirosa kalamazoonensis]